METNINNKILLIGDLNEAFVPGHSLDNKNISLCTDIKAGVEAAAKGSWGVIALVVSSAGGILKPVLASLRDAQPDAKIILLSRMSEEPVALELIRTSGNGSGLADDYLICPIEVSDFYNFVLFHSATQTDRIGAGSDIEMHRRIKELEKLATTDDLTGLKNRRYVWEFCSQIIDYAKARGGKVTLLMFDIDYFKHYNDIYSHTAGDEILKQVAVLMRRCCRPHDVVGRIGGDEFVVIFWDIPEDKIPPKPEDRRSLQSDHPKEAILIAQRFRAELKKAQLPLLGDDRQGILTISGGLASFPRDGSTAAVLFSQVDKALLDAKRSGKNRIYLVGKSKNDIGNIE